MHHFNLYLGKYIVEGVKIKLELYIEIDENDIFMTIPLPENYPATQVGNSEIVIEEGLFKAQISVLPDNFGEWMDIWESAREHMGIYEDDIAFVLNGYYILPKSNNIRTTLEERNMLRGLGKLSLCKGMEVVLKFFDLENSERLILLEASGGDVNYEDEARISEYLKLGRDKILQELRTKYKNAYILMYDDFEGMTDKEIAESIVTVQNNKKLVGYYVKSFGFSVLQDNVFEVMMTASTLDFVSHC